MKRKLLLLLIIVLVLIAATPFYQASVTRFRSLIVSDDVTVGDSLSVTGDTTLTGALSVTGGFSPSGGGSFSPNVIVAGATAQGTATPVVRILAPGVSNPFEIRSNLTATPFIVLNPTAGARVNNAIIGSAAGKKLVCVTQTVTGTASVSHGLATPEAAVCSLAADPVGDNWCTYTNSAGVITVKVWTGILATPAAAGDAVSVTTCVIGNP